MNRLDNLVNENASFIERIEMDNLSVQRQPCPYAIITCMDPRVNLEAVGIMPFTEKGEAQSQVRIIRTLGAVADDRSLLAGIHLAGFNEIAIIMHTDCGCCLAWSKVDTIIQSMQEKLSQTQIKQFEEVSGELDKSILRQWLNAFQDPEQAAVDQIDLIRQKPFVPKDIIIHGLVYDLQSGSIKVIVNGYDE